MNLIYEVDIALHLACKASRDPYKVLSQIEENLSAWSEKHGFNVMDKPDNERDVTLEELLRANEVVLSKSGVGNDLVVIVRSGVSLVPTVTKGAGYSHPQLVL